MDHEALLGGPAAKIPLEKHDSGLGQVPIHCPAVFHGVREQHRAFLRSTAWRFRIQQEASYQAPAARPQNSRDFTQVMPRDDGLIVLENGHGEGDVESSVRIWKPNPGWLQLPAGVIQRVLHRKLLEMEVAEAVSENRLVPADPPAHRLNPFVAGLWREVIAQNIGHPAETAPDVEYGLVASQASFIDKQLQTEARLRQEAPSHK